jgi:Helix-turn-helix
MKAGRLRINTDNGEVVLKGSHFNWVWQRVSELGLERRLSQEKLAQLADLQRSYLGGVELGERNIALLNIVALAHALKVRPPQAT